MLYYDFVVKILYCYALENKGAKRLIFIYLDPSIFLLRNLG